MLELDHSQCYKKHRGNDHTYKNFNLHTDRSTPFVRIIEANHDSIGPYHHDHAAKPGDVTHHEFDVTDQPPKINPHMPMLGFFDVSKCHNVTAKKTQIRKAKSQFSSRRKHPRLTQKMQKFETTC